MVLCSLFFLIFPSFPDNTNLYYLILSQLNGFQNFNYRGRLASVRSALNALFGPKYDGQYLHQVVREKLGEIRLHETLTNIVVPTFDIKNLQPTIFSTYEVSLCMRTRSETLSYHREKRKKK